MKFFNRKNILIVGFILLILVNFTIKNTPLQVLFFLGYIGLLLYTYKNQFGLYLANKAYEKGDYETSFARYEAYLATPKARILPKIIYSYRLLQRGHLEKSYELLQSLNYESLTDVEKRNYNATLALIHMKKGSFGRAIELFENIFNEKANQLGYETLGYLYICGKRYSEALTFNKKAIEAYPDSTEVKNNLGMSYYYKDLYPEAAEIFEALIEMNTPLLEPYYYYGLMLGEQGDLKEAIDLLAIGADKPEIYLRQLKQDQIRTQLLAFQETLKNKKTAD